LVTIFESVAMAVGVIYLYGDILHYTKINSKGVNGGADLASFIDTRSTRHEEIGWIANFFGQP
jgi:hypothetical protein